MEEFTIGSFWSHERCLFIWDRALSFRAAFLHRDFIWASNLSRKTPNNENIANPENTHASAY